MATRNPKAQPISTVLEPNFEGGLIHNDWIRGTVFIKITKAQRNNNIPALSRSLDGENATMCFVVNDNTFYRLINNPIADVTTDADWKVTSQISGGSSVIPVGLWDASNTAPMLQDVDAVDRNGEFYYVRGAPNEVDVTFGGLFLGQTRQIINNDWIISVGTHWEVIANTTTWDILDVPQVIVDYENGIVIAHSHEISDVNNLSNILSTKYDADDLANMVLDYIDVPDSGIVNVAFLRRHFYDKTFVYNRTEIDALLSLLSLGDPIFDGNRAIRKLPVVGENVGKNFLGATVDEMFYGFIKPTTTLQQFPVEQVGESVTPQGIGSLDPKDASSITGNLLIKDEGANVAATIVPDAAPAITNFNEVLVAKTIVAGTNQWYYLEYNYKKEAGDPDTPVVSPSIFLNGVYPFLTGMAAVGLIGSTIYAALNKTVVDRGSRAFAVNGAGRVYIAYPAIYGLLTEIVDGSGNNLIGSLFSDTPVVLAVDSVGLAADWQTDYNVYESLYDGAAENQIYIAYFDSIETVTDLNLTLDTIPEGITNVHLTTVNRDKLDGIVVPVADLGDMKKSEFRFLTGLTGLPRITDKAVELVASGWNTTGAPIAAGIYVKIVGIDPATFSVPIEVADKDSNDTVDAFANETIADGERGVIIIRGYNPFVDTTGAPQGSQVYLGAAGGILFTKPTSGSLIEVGQVIFEGNTGLVQSLGYKHLLSDNQLVNWRENTEYLEDTVIAIIDTSGNLIHVRAKEDHNSGSSYDPSKYDSLGGDMLKSVYDFDDDGIIEESFTQVTTATNETGITIPRGRLIYLSDFNATSGFAEITLADKDAHNSGNAITIEEIVDGATGKILINGSVGGLNVSAVPILSPVYLDTLGTFTTTRPLSGLIQQVGIVIFGHPSDGAIFFNLGEVQEPKINDWVTNTPYAIDQIVAAVVETPGDPPTEITVIIRCKVAHTSNVLSSDFDSGFWELVSGDMVSWIYDAAQKKVDVYDMDNMDDGAANVAMTVAERTKLAGLEDARAKGFFASADALRIEHPTSTDGDSAGVIATSTTWLWDSGATPNVSPPTVGGDWEDSLAGIGGDMLASLYDPSTVAGDAFDLDNMVEGADVLKLFFTQVEKTKLAAFGLANTYYTKTESNNLLALKASIIYVDAQDVLQMTITIYDPNTIGGDVFDMDNMVEGSATKILTSDERADIAANKVEVAKERISGGIYHDGGGSGTTVSAGEVAETTTLFGSAINADMPASGRLRATKAGAVVVVASLSTELVGNNTQARFQIAVNGTPVAGAFATVQRATSTVLSNPAITVPLTLSINDYVSIFMAGGDVDLYDLTMTINGKE